MTERIDHVVKAKAWVEAAEQPGLTVPGTNMLSGIAQAHATLALVEQQRIANLIALAGRDASSFEEALPILHDEAASALMQFVRREATQILDPEDFPEVRPEIREALGLS